MNRTNRSFLECLSIIFKELMADERLSFILLKAEYHFQKVFDDIVDHIKEKALAIVGRGSTLERKCWREFGKREAVR
jgi:hypothetical protein